MKGESTIDWSDKRARAALLAGIVGDADRLLELSRQAQGELPEDSAERQRIVLDTDSQLITAVEVLPGNAPDNLGALELVPFPARFVDAWKAASNSGFLLARE